MEDRRTVQRRTLLQLVRERGPIGDKDLQEALRAAGPGAGRSDFQELMAELVNRRLVSHQHGPRGRKEWVPLIPSAGEAVPTFPARAPRAEVRPPTRYEPADLPGYPFHCMTCSVPVQDTAAHELARHQ